MAKSLLVCLLVLWGVTMAPEARAADTQPPKGQLPELLRAIRSADVGRGQFQLELPVLGRPLTISWQRGFTPGYEMLRVPVYDWDTHLLHRGPLDLLAFNRVRSAMELDCSSVPCAPAVERTMGTEVRLNLGGSGVIPENHLFLRRETVINPVRSYSRLGFGIGGVLDL
jgi:hypothetical protein